MISNRVRYLRGVVGTALTWGALWATLNTIVLFMRWLPAPPEYTTRGRMVVSILTNQSVSALLWGTVLGALFSVAISSGAMRWPSTRPLNTRRLTWVGAVVGLGLGASLVQLGSWFEILGIAALSLASAGVGALLGSIAQRAQRKLAAESTMPRITST